MSDRKTILFVTPDLAMGGAQRSISNVAAALAANYHVKVVVFNREHTVAYADVLSQVEILSLDVIPGPSWLSKFSAMSKRITRLRMIKRNLKPVASISFLEGADYINIISRVGERIILSIRGSKLHDEIMLRSNFALRKRIITSLYKRADAIVCVNHGIVNELIENYKLPANRLRVIYNFYDHAMIKQKSQEELSPEMNRFFQHAIISMSGRLSIEKGQVLIVRALAELKKRNPSIKLLLVGDGPEKDNIMTQAKALGLTAVYKTIQGSPDIFITGEVSNVFKYVSRSKIYVLNSSSEGFPNGLAEAMICGVPVLSSDCPYGPAEILGKDSPQLIPFVNVSSDAAIDAWTNRILTLVNDENQRGEFSRKGIDRMSSFDSSTLVAQWIEVIEK